MRAPVGWLAVLAAVTLTGAAGARDKNEKYVLYAERAGWMLGMYVGEKKDHPYPFVIQVDKDSDAALKGIQPGDDIIRFEGQQPYSLRWLVDRVKDTAPGRQVTVWVRRGAETRRFFVIVPRNPAGPPAAKAEKPAKKPKPDETADPGEDKEKKRKKRPPIVVKPIPPDGDGERQTRRAFPRRLHAAGRC
jgi:predicted metalloprotease with PDZ domain